MGVLKEIGLCSGCVGDRSVQWVGVRREVCAVGVWRETYVSGSE